MLAALSLLIAQIPIESQLNLALKHVSRFDRSFHAAIGPVLAKGDMELEWVFKPFGNRRARIIFAKDLANPAFGMEKGFVAWRSGSQIRIQALWRPGTYEESKTHAIWSNEIYVGRDRIVECGELQDDTNAPRPAVRLYRLVDRSWQQWLTVLGDSEAAEPTPHFVRKGGRPDPCLVAFSTRPYPDHVLASHVGTHLLCDYRFEVTSRGIRRISIRRRDTPMAALEDLTAAEKRGDRVAFDKFVAQADRAGLWSLIRKANDHFSGCSNDDEILGTDFYVGGDEGFASVTHTLQFRRVGGHWLAFGLRKISPGS